MASLISKLMQANGAGTRPQSLRVGSLDRFDRWTLGLVGVVFAVLLANLPHLKPSMSDTWYHLGVAKRVLEERGVPAWDWWNYAPAGRPHLYPPLLHVIIALLAGLSGSVILAGQLCAASFLPVGLLTTWYCARRLLDSRLALLAVVILLADLFHFIIMEAYIAGCLINILMPLLMVSFLGRRPWWSILLMTLMYYSHLGFPHCVALGLVLFGLRYRQYLRLALKVVLISLLFYTPWLSQVVGHLDWLPVLRQGGMPGDPLRKLFSLQFVNLVLLGVGLWGIVVAPRRVPARMLPVYMLIGFLPILFTYGGRYTMHTMPLWAMLGASVLGRLLPDTAGGRRIVGIMALSLLPLPSLGFTRQLSFIPFTGAHMLVMLTCSGRTVLDSGEKSEAYRSDCDELAAYLTRETAPDEIIYVNTVWIADMVSLLTDRRTDFGAWWECSKEEEKLRARALRDWQDRAVFVYIKPEADVGSVLWETPSMPGVDAAFSIGRFDIGLRNPHRLRRSGTTVGNWVALAAAGATGTVSPIAGGLRWQFRTGQNRLALISARVPPKSVAGARFRLSANAMTGDLVFGIRTDRGWDYRWPLSIPRANEESNVRVVFAWMVDEEGREWRGEPVREVYFACPPSGTSGKAEERIVEVRDVELLVE